MNMDTKKEHALGIESPLKKHEVKQTFWNVKNWIVSKYHKRYMLLKTSWTYQTDQFFDNTSVHGVRYINETNRPFFERFMWFLFTSVGAVATMVVIVALWGKFQNNPTLTGLDTDYLTWDVKFPAISLCPSNPVDSKKVDDYRLKMWGDNKTTSTYKDFLIDVANLSNYNLKKFTVHNEKINFTVTDLRELQANLVRNCETMFQSCIFKGKPFNCCDRIIPFSTEIGFCYAFNSRHAHTLDNGTITSDFKDEQIDEVDADWLFKLQMPIYNDQRPNLRIYVHSSGEVPTVELQPLYVWSHDLGMILFSDKETYTTSDSRQLTIKQRNCVFPDEIALDTDIYYTFSGCKNQCRLRYAKEKCNCIPPFYRKIVGYKHCDLKGLGCLSKFSSLFDDDPENCECTFACLNHVYVLEKQQRELLTFDDHLTIGFESRPTVRYKKEVLFGWVDLLVSFGGIGGLFLGFSLLTGVEFMYYFLLRSVCMTLRNVEELEDLQLEYDKKEREIIDLSLVPSFCRTEDHKQAVINIGRDKEFPLILKPKSYHKIHMEEKEMGITDRIRYQD